MGNEAKLLYLDFDQYIRQGEPSRRKRAEAWSIAIGLQAVDGLTTSDYLQQTARRNIEGDISIDEARELIRSYYLSKTTRETQEEDKEEADKVSANIAKREWVLDGDTVSYLNWEDLRRALDYDIAQEKAFSYKGITPDTLITHLASFISGIWQIHPFEEGNTRTTAVFAILYLRSLGFPVNNDMFARHSWYFRNALVRANYKSAVKGIDYTPDYLERFLRNRYLHIHPAPEWSVQPRLDTPASTPTSTPTSLSLPDNTNILNVILAIGQNQLSVKQIMQTVGLRDRENFMEYSLHPSITGGYVRLRYPDKPRHPQQSYLLTEKGTLVLESLSKKNV
ncbi:MAG: Fic family protein [Bacteroidales bacterium]|nr:Fic family protein [Bacteroidales bacterium]